MAKTPFTVRHALFITEEPKGFGSYTPRASAPFKAGEQPVVYAEPVAFGWKSVEDGQYEFGFTVDFILKTAAGKIIGGQDKFANVVLKVGYKTGSFFLNWT